MNHLQQYYRNLCEQLQEQIVILEKKVEEAKKKAKKDYDGDGKIETSEEEYMGSKDKAIKKAIAAKKKKTLKEGRIIGDESFTYGGFPRVLNEAQAATHAFQDSPEQGQTNVATKSNEEEEDLYVPHGMGLRYPSAEYKGVASAATAAEEEASKLHKAMSSAKHSAYLQHMQGHYGKGAKHSAARSQSFQFTADPEMTKQAQAASAKAEELKKQREAHPHHADFMKAAEAHYKLVRGGNYGE